MLELTILAPSIALFAGSVAGPSLTAQPALPLLGETSSPFLATTPAVPYGRVLDVRQSGNGRLFSSPGEVGGAPLQMYWSGDEPGPAAYGAAEADSQVVYGRHGLFHVMPVSPWHRIDQPQYRDLEAARNAWLKENGYTGGVRTFVNEAVRAEENDDGEIRPAMILNRPVDAPAFKRRMEVRGCMSDAEASRIASALLSGEARVHLPHSGGMIVRYARLTVD